MLVTPLPHGACFLCCPNGRTHVSTAILAGRIARRPAGAIDSGDNKLPPVDSSAGMLRLRLSRSVYVCVGWKGRESQMPVLVLNASLQPLSVIPERRLRV